MARKQQTPMDVAALCGDTETVLDLLNAGADVNALGAYTYRPLMHAASMGHLDLVRLLLERGALVDATTPDVHRSALYYALEHTHLTCARLLIEAGADVNAVDATGMTLLMHAVTGGNLRVVRFLLEQGADIEIKGDSGTTALKMASSFAHDLTLPPQTKYPKHLWHVRHLVRKSKIIEQMLLQAGAKE